MIPAYCASVSAVVLILHLVLLSSPAQNIWARVVRRSDDLQPATSPETGANIHAGGLSSDAKAFVSQHGGPIIFGYKVARFVGCLALLGLSLATFILEEREEHTLGALDKHWGGKRPKHRASDDQPLFSRAEWHQFALCMASVRRVYIFL